MCVCALAEDNFAKLHPARTRIMLVIQRKLAEHRLRHTTMVDRYDAVTLSDAFKYKAE